MVTVVVIVTFWSGRCVFEMTKRGKKFNARTGARRLLEGKRPPETGPVALRKKFHPFLQNCAVL
jgi:hypothetical protein